MNWKNKKKWKLILYLFLILKFSSITTFVSASNVLSHINSVNPRKRWNEDTKQKKVDFLNKITDDKIVKGKVVDNKNNPLVGVAVVIRDTRHGTVTNANGNFSIDAKKGDVLIFSFIGMKTKEIEYKGEFLNVILNVNVQELGEIVCTGYEIIEKRNLTSSVTSLKMNKIKEINSINIDGMLQGKVPGMVVMKTSSSLNAAPKIRIRGTSTLIGNREPVWVVDGVILEDPVQISPTELNSMDKVNYIGNAVSGINPWDIERIDVLKDASATAIYGTKAANGVIVITTKKSKSDKLTVSYSNSIGFTRAPSYKNMHLMNSLERTEVSEDIEKMGLRISNMYKTTNVGYEGELFKLYNNIISYNQFVANVKKLKEKNTNWYDLLFRNAFTQTHNFSASGGGDFVRYYTSMSYSNNKGASIAENQKRYNTSLKLDFKFNKKLKGGLSFRFSNNDLNRSHSSVGLYKYAHETSRLISPYNEKGSYNYYDVKRGYSYGIAVSKPLNYNIFNELDQTGFTQNTKTINLSYNLNYKINKNINFSSLIAYNTSTYTSEEHASEKSYYISKYRKTRYGEKLDQNIFKRYTKYCQLPYGGILDIKNSSVHTFSFRPQLNIKKNLEKHFLNLLIGGYARTVHRKGNDSKVLGYYPNRGKQYAKIDPTIWYQGYANLLKKSQDLITDSKNNTISYFTSFTYSYDNRYVFNANVRGDASNKLGQDRSAKFLPIWSFSGRWNISKEKFMSNILWINNLSVKTSLGLQGNVTNAHNPNLVVRFHPVDAMTGEYKNTQASLPNPKLRWEKTTSYNTGLDMFLFDNKIAISIEYYNKKSTDQLYMTEIESTNGTDMAFINSGTIKNQGWELSLRLNPIKTKNFDFTLSFNTSKNYNKVSNIYEDAATSNYKKYLNGSVIKTGKSINGFYSYRFNKLDEKGKPTFLGLNLKDEKGNTQIHTPEEALSMGLVYSGKKEPSFSGGFNLFTRYKRWTLTSCFYTQLGSKIRLNKLYSSNRLPVPEKNMKDEYVKRWRKPGDENYTNIPALSDYASLFFDGYKLPGSYDMFLGNNIYDFYDNSDLRVVSGNFLRCRSVNLSYKIAKSLLEKFKIQNCNLSFSVSNPFVIKSSKLKGKDPEQINLNSGAIPPQASYNFSVNLTF